VEHFDRPRASRQWFEVLRMAEKSHLEGQAW
jgi:hypothetical protein